MTENQTNSFNPDANMSRRDFLRLLEAAGLGTALLWLTGCRPKNLLVPPVESPTPLLPTNLPEATTTTFPTDTPTQAGETTTATQAPTPEPSSTPIPKELEYAHHFSEGTDLRKTVGAIDWTKTVDAIIPNDANVISDEKTNFQLHPIVVENETSWNELLPKRNKFNEWWNPNELTMVFEGRPVTHPFVLLHAYQLKDGSRTFAGEYFRQAIDKEKIDGENPLIGKTWFFDQLDVDGKLQRTEMKFVHMTALTADDFWSSLFYSNVDDNGQIMVDHHLAWQPNPNKLEERIPLIPPEHQGSQHLTVATCDKGKAAIATLEVISVKEVANPLTLFWFGLRQGLTEALA